MKKLVSDYNFFLC